MNLIVLSARSLQRRRLRNTLCIVIIALSVMLTITVGSTSSRYITAIHGISSFYSGYVALCAKGSIFIQAIPIGGFLLGNTVDYAKALNETKYAVPLLYLLPAQTSYDLSSIIQSNLMAGIPLGNVTILVVSTPLMTGGRWPQGNNSSREVVVGRFYSENSMLKLEIPSKLRTSTSQSSEFSTHIMISLLEPSSCLFPPPKKYTITGR